jgi:5-(carboxyamino)imidazole ribonucleotide synthase
VSSPQTDTPITGRAEFGPPTLGIIGGGQLAKMTAQAAFQLGCEVVVLERQNEFPASSLDTHTLIGDWHDPEKLRELASMTDVVTLENEFVDAEALAILERDGHRLFPSSATIRTVQDKLRQKQVLSQADLPVTKFIDTPDLATARAAAKNLGWPLVLKKRRNGYDGKGNATVESAKELEAAWKHLEGDSHALFVEAVCPFTIELAVMIARGQRGEEITYPVVETGQQDHICHIVKAPAQISGELAERATELARGAVAAVQGVGAMGVELFLTRAGEILINELAPRVHNSGHYSIEACTSSQFENHVRAVLGWPLGSSVMLAKAVVMINLLGAGEGSGEPRGLADALRVDGAHVHIYGKTRSVRGRKMGHVTALGNSMEEAMRTAQQAAARIRFGNNS